LFGDTTFVKKVNLNSTQMLRPSLSPTVFLGKQALGEQGFSLPAALGFGLIILIVGQTLILRSYSDRVASLGQVAGNAAVGAAEIGLTRYQAFLNRNRELAFMNACVPTETISPTSLCGANTWRNAETSPDLAGKVCPTSPLAVRTQRLQALAAQDTAAWQDVDPNDLSQGQFRLISYSVDDASSNPTGKLTVEGRIPAGGTANTAAARLQITIPLTRSQMGQPEIYPGVWLQTLDTRPSLGNPGSPTPTPEPVMDVRANVFVSDCGVDLRTIKANPSSGAPTHVVMQTDTPMPALPPLPTISANPSANPSPQGGGTTAPQDNSLKAYGLGDISRALTLPRPTDTGIVETGTQVYRYVADNLHLSSSERLTINTTPKQVQSQTLPVRVELYLRGDLRADSKVDHDCDPANGVACEPTNFRLYAYQFATQPPPDGVYPSYCITGSNRTLKAMIFAPGYRIGTRGSAKLQGSLWANTWDTDNCRATAGKITLSQSGSWGNQQVMLPPRLGAVSQWQRQQVTTP
jgi:hypothetical protein